MNSKYAVGNTQYTVQILGVEIDNVTTEQALRHISSFVEEGWPHQIVTVNPEFVMTAQRLPVFRDVINRADLRIPDGVGLLWAARRLGTPLQERVAGSDLVPLIARQAARLGHRTFLLGAAPGVAEKAAARLVHLAPGVMIVGTHAGSPAVEEEDDIVEMIRIAAPDILFVAYGAPQQDLWIARNLDRLEVPVAMGVGGVFDFLAGVTRRAPPWIRHLGFEWLHRLIQEPWRWRRQLDIPRFMWHVVREETGGARGGRGSR
ncbi:MAG: WecB/TagA/CpsF family glycosyltransferase [Anaerolineae bacterium]